MENRYRKARDPVARSHHQIIWLISEGKTIDRVMEVIGYSIERTQRVSMLGLLMSILLWVGAFFWHRACRKPLDSTNVPQFYHRDVVGHHDGYRGSQELGYDDIVNRLDWDKQTFSDPVYDIHDIIAVEDRFAVRFNYKANIVATGEEARSEAAYFYYLKDGKIAEFWLLADVDFDYRKNFSIG